MTTKNSQPWQEWSFQFSVGQRLVTVGIPPRLLLVLFCVGVLGFALGSRQADAEHRRQSERLASLEIKAAELQRSLETHKAERDELEALAGARLEELSEQLTDREYEVARLWSLVGRQTADDGRRTSLASRSGSRRSSGVMGRYQDLKSRIDTGQEELSRLSEAAKVLHRARQAELAKRIPSGVPCQGEMTSGFGSRVHPVYGVGRHHNGCDFTADYGTPIHATAAGRVVRADWFGGYGQTVEIDHGNGWKTLYAHCDTMMVKNGQTVKKGQPIGTVGTTGLSSGPHCHYEVHKDGKAVDPIAFLPPSVAKKARAKATG